MAINVLATAGISLDAAGLYRKTTSPADNVFIFTDGANNWEIIDKKGPYVARLGGIIPSAGDVTSALQTILNSSDVKEVVFDEGNITINGTLNVPSGKKLTFQNDGRLIGTGTIVGGLINADFESNIFAQTLTITDSSTYPLSVGNRHFSVKWFGAVGDGGVDDQPAIQKTVDTLIALTAFKGKVKSVYLPIGKYRIDNPIVLYKWSAAANRYMFFSLDFVGESTFWEFDNSGSEILVNFIDKFAIGVQLGKGVRIENIRLTGQFRYQFVGATAAEQNKNFYASTYANFLGTLPCRDSRYSPYSGIVVDPFGDNVPSDGGYPGMTSYYRGSTGATGSTGIIIQECFVDGFVVGAITSPSGQTLNGELVDIFRIQFRDCKACVAGTQAQEKINRVSFMASWGKCHTVFMFNEYGGQNPGYWSVDNVNLAGYNNRFIRRAEGGYFPMKINSIYAETLGTIGEMDFQMATQISDSIFDLMPIFDLFNPSSDYATRIYPQSVATGNASFKNVVVRWYGQSYLPIPFSGRFTFSECKITSPVLSPNNATAPNIERGNGSVIMDNCWGDGLGGGAQIGCSYPQTISPDNNYQFYADGKTVIQSPLSTAYNIVESWSPKYSIPSAYYLEYINSAAYAVTVSGINNTWSFTAAGSELDWVASGDIIEFSRFGDFAYPRSYGYGIASVSGTTITINYISSSVTPDNYYLRVYKKMRHLAFMGDITAGSNTITNVRLDNVSTSAVDLILGVSSGYNESVFLQDVVAANWSQYGKTAFVLTNWNNSTKTFTANKNFNVTKTGVYFANNGYVKDVSCYSTDYNVLTSNDWKQIILQKGGRVTVMENGEPVTYVVTRTGYIDAVSQSDTRQAQWALESCCSVVNTTTTSSTTTSSTTTSSTTSSTTTAAP
jgi:hypothetical protein